MSESVRDVEMGRVSVMLPVETIAQIDAWAAQTGVKRGQFASMALAIGARALARQVSPEAFFTADTWSAFAKALGVEVEQLQEAVKAVKKA